MSSRTSLSASTRSNGSISPLNPCEPHRILAENRRRSWCRAEKQPIQEPHSGKREVRHAPACRHQIYLAARLSMERSNVIKKVPAIVMQAVRRSSMVTIGPHIVRCTTGPTSSGEAPQLGILLTKSLPTRCTTFSSFHTPCTVIGRGVQTTCTSSPFVYQENIDTVITFPQFASLHCWALFVREGDIISEDAIKDPDTPLADELVYTHLPGGATYQAVGHGWWVSYNPQQDHLTPETIFTSGRLTHELPH